MSSSFPPRIPPQRVSESLRAALASVTAALRAFPERGMLIGDVAVAAHGVARTVETVGATLATARELSDVVTELERHGFAPRAADVLAYARAEQLIPLVHSASGTSVDVALAWLPFELDALACAEEHRLGGVDLTVARAEDLVIYKAIGWRPRDQEDLERLVALHGSGMDFERVRRVVAEFALALEAPERLSEVEAVIQRGLGQPSEQHP